MGVVSMNYTSDDMPRRHPEFDGILRGNPGLAEYIRQLEEMSIRDTLTGLYNAGFYQEALNREFSRAYRRQYSGSTNHNGTLALILDDLDNFKGVNDTYGHKVGDEVLRRTAQIKRRRLRTADYPCRIGGEEGAIILPSTDVNDAIWVADDLRKTIGDFDIRFAVKAELDALAGKTCSKNSARFEELGAVFEALSGKPELRITVSQGIGIYPAEGIGTAAVLHSMTDNALYRAKALGRNRACMADDL